MSAMKMLLMVLVMTKMRMKMMMVMLVMVNVVNKAWTIAPGRSEGAGHLFHHPLH